MKTNYDSFEEVLPNEVNPRLKSDDGSASLPIGSYEVGTLRWCPAVAADGKKWQGFPLISEDATPRFLSANQIKGIAFVNGRATVVNETPFSAKPAITAIGKTIEVTGFKSVQIDKFGEKGKMVSKSMPVFTVK